MIIVKKLKDSVGDLDVKSLNFLVLPMEIKPLKDIFSTTINHVSELKTQITSTLDVVEEETKQLQIEFEKYMEEKNKEMERKKQSVGLERWKKWKRQQIMVSKKYRKQMLGNMGKPRI